MLITNIGQLVTPQGNTAVAGDKMGELVILNDAFVEIKDSYIETAGLMKDLPASANHEIIDAQGDVMLPGLVDPHTHAVFSGSREDEFLARCLGEPYGKGILTSMRNVRAASEKELYDSGKKFLQEMIALGTTTAEVKSGYGLDTESELKLLRVIKNLRNDLPIEIVPTFLGAHAVPNDIESSDYVEKIIDEMIPQVAQENLAEYCDVFCETGFFTVEESRAILTAGKKAGMKPKIHAEEIYNTGGAELAAELGATSADHLEQISQTGMEAMGNSGTIPVLLPGTAFTLNLEYPPARKMIKANLPVALGSDFNPGTCLIYSMYLVISLAVMRMKMSVEESITACTLNAAAALDRSGSIGSLEPGKRADLVLLALENYKQIPYFVGHNIVNTVVASGKVVHKRTDGFTQH
jgi:imidazolonepropionase